MFWLNKCFNQWSVTFINWNRVTNRRLGWMTGAQTGQLSHHRTMSSSNIILICSILTYLRLALPKLTTYVRKCNYVPYKNIFVITVQLCKNVIFRIRVWEPALCVIQVGNDTSEKSLDSSFWTGCKLGNACHRKWHSWLVKTSSPQ